MSDLAELIETVEQTVGAADGGHRRQMLLGVTDLLVGTAPELSDAHRHAFDAVLGRLIGRAEAEERRTVAERVSALREPPPGLVRRLAADPAGPVAAPILRSRIPIPDAALIRLANSRSQEHLAAIAQRATLSERVSTVLAERGDEAVLGTLLANPGARLTEAALTLAVTRIADDETLMAGLARRSELDPKRRAALLGRRLRDKDARGDARGLGRVHPRADKQMRARAEAAVALRVGIGLDEVDILHWLENGRTAEALTALAHLAAVATDRAFRAQADPDPRALTLLVRAAGLGTGTLTRLLLVAGRAGSGRALGDALALFQGMAVDEARGLLAREEAAEA